MAYLDYNEPWVSLDINFMSEKIKTELCIRDFYTMLDDAMKKSGGGEADAWKKQTIEEFAEMFARHGIRIVYMPNRHMNAVKVVWEDNTNNNIPYTPPNQPLPKKKQLLCDQLEKNDGSWSPAF